MSLYKLNFRGQEPEFKPEYSHLLCNFGELLIRQAPHSFVYKISDAWVCYLFDIVYVRNK